MNTAQKLSTDQIEKGWRETFSVDNPFCPCDLRSFTKAVNWTLRALAPPSGEGVEPSKVTHDAALSQALREACALYESQGKDIEHCDVCIGVLLGRTREILRTAATPQPAPVDYSHLYNVPLAKSIAESLGQGFKLIYRDAFRWKNSDGDVLPNHYDGQDATGLAASFDYDLVADLGFAAIIRTTPPPASQERGGLRWPSSLGIAAIAREIWGNPIPPEAYAFAKRLHSAASPPSSAAEASINPPEIDSKLIPDAAEQAKPAAIDPTEIDSKLIGAQTKASMSYDPTTKVATVQAYDEQAQAGELPPLPESFGRVHNDGYWTIRTPGTERFTAHDSRHENPAQEVYTADQMRDYANAFRLAGGVTVDDVMVERAIIGAMAQARRDGVAMGDQRWDGSFPTRTMWRAALVAALGAK